MPHGTFPQLHTVRLEFDTFLNVEVLKNFTYHCVIRSPGLQVVEYRGKELVMAIFKALSDQTDPAHEGGTRLLPDDFRAVCKDAPEMLRMRTICDFIAGMTDRYAIEFYGRREPSHRPQAPLIGLRGAPLPALAQTRAVPGKSAPRARLAQGAGEMGRKSAAGGGNLRVREHARLPESRDLRH